MIAAVYLSQNLITNDPAMANMSSTTLTMGISHEDVIEAAIGLEGASAERIVIVPGKSRPAISTKRPGIMKKQTLYRHCCLPGHHPNFVGGRDSIEIAAHDRWKSRVCTKGNEL